MSSAAQQLGSRLLRVTAATTAASARSGSAGRPWLSRGLSSASVPEHPTPTATSSSGPAASSSQSTDAASSQHPITSSSTSSSDPDVPEGYRVMYQGFFARPHKRLKYASLLNTFASFAAAPLIVTYSTASPIARVAVTVSVVAFAVITTGGLHWFTSPYVHQLLYNDKADTARVQTLKFFGGTRWHEFPVSAVETPTGYHPLASFKVQGKTFYVDRGNFEDTALLERLGGPGEHAAAHPATAAVKSTSSEEQQQ